jgi:hypothetical protein
MIVWLLVAHLSAAEAAQCGSSTGIDTTIQHSMARATEKHAERIWWHDKFVTACSIGVVYGCETWSLTLREEHRLRVLENRVLRRIFGPKGDEVTGEWRKLHNEELPDLYSSPSIIRIIKMRWEGHVARMGAKRNAYRLLVGEPEGKRPLGRPRRRWVDNIRMGLGKTGWGGVDWIGKNSCEHGNEPLGSIKRWETIQ